MYMFTFCVFVLHMLVRIMICAYESLSDVVLVLEVKRKSLFTQQWVSNVVRTYTCVYVCTVSM